MIRRIKELTFEMQHIDTEIKSNDKHNTVPKGIKECQLDFDLSRDKKAKYAYYPTDLGRPRSSGSS